MNKKITYYNNAVRNFDVDFENTLLTNFLDEAECSDLLTAIKKKYNVAFDGGFLEAERKRALIGIDDASELEISICRINYDKRYGEINHRQVLGTVISLGIKREMIGDIVFDNNNEKEGIIYFATTNQLAPYFKTELKCINRCNVNINILTPEEVKNIPLQEGITDKIITSSMRLDAVLAACMKISRNDATEKITSKMILVNHRICENNHYLVKCNDLISIRKYGRIQIINNLGQTKKERLILQIKRWH